MLSYEIRVGESPLAPHRVSRTLALVLAGGAGSRLKDLTRWHAKPALPIAGHYRNIDFSLSNCVNSGIRRIAVLTQYKAHSLIQHLNRAWNIFQPDLGEFIELWPAQQRCEPDWYKGTANAVYQNLDIVEEYAPEYVLVLAGDHVYKMDYAPMLHQHAVSGADVTVGCLAVGADQAREFGVMAAGEGGRIETFVEKPRDPSPYVDEDGRVLVSMGVYVFSMSYLRRALHADAIDPGTNHDFGRNIIPEAVRRNRAYCYRFGSASGEEGNGYWRDVGTVDAYWRTNMEMLGECPPLDLADPDWPIRSYREQLPPARFIRCGPHAPGVAQDSMVADGCVIRGARVDRSVLFPGVHVDAGSEVRESVVLPGAHIGKRCRLRRVVVSSGCRITDGTVIGEDPLIDQRRYHISDSGIVLVSGAAAPRRAGRVEEQEWEQIPVAASAPGRA